MPSAMVGGPGCVARRTGNGLRVRMRWQRSSSRVLQFPGDCQVLPPARKLQLEVSVPSGCLGPGGLVSGVLLRVGGIRKPRQASSGRSLPQWEQLSLLGQKAMRSRNSSEGVCWRMHSCGQHQIRVSRQSSVDITAWLGSSLLEPSWRPELHQTRPGRRGPHLCP